MQLKEPSRRIYMFATAVYLLILSLLFLLPREAFSQGIFTYLVSYLHALAYLVLAWLALAALGRCPLRWRSVAPWVFVIALAHAYWMEFLQGALPVPGRQSSWIDLAASLLGAAGGIWLRLRFAYRSCNCGLTVHKTDSDASVHTMQPHTSHEGIPSLITHHPALPAIIARTFGWKTMELSPDAQWRLSLVCTGKSLVSLPHFSYGALFTTNNNDEAVEKAESWLARMHFDKGFAGIEWRKPDPGTLNHHKLASWLRLEPTMELQFSSFSGNLGRKIRKASRNGLVTVQGGKELLNDFYSVYARHMRTLGSGALPKRFFENMLAGYTDAYAGIFLVRLNGKVIGGAFNLSYRGFYENGWFATLKPYQRLYPSYLLHSEMIAHAISLGCHTYSFGRSTPGGGVHQFKQQWNTYDVPLTWLVFPVPTVHLRHQTWIRKIWKLLPYPLGNKFGNYIAKWIY
jgi:VanZ family protein